MPIPDFTFFLDRPDTPVTPQSHWWDRPLPGGPAGDPASPAGREPAVTYGEYFTHALAFLADCHCRRLRQALAGQGATAIGRIDAVGIHLVKHGAFYHPARIDVHRGPHCARLALNVAASAQGRALMGQEVRSLRLLTRRFGPGYLPRVHTHGRTGPLPMFLADWIDGFHEFHWSRDPRDGRLRLAVWDPAKGAVALSERLTRSLFCQTARVLTWYFDLNTFNHIGGWHHGAGDFVVRLTRSRPTAVRLVSVRRYGPLLKSACPELLPSALLLFLVKLSLQNRMDRRDGVHEPVLADETVVAATVDGFLQAMTLKARAGVISRSLQRHLRQHLRRQADADLQDLVAAVAALLEKQAPPRLWHPAAQHRHSGLLHAAINHFCAT
jgi:hypothetical protein